MPLNPYRRIQTQTPNAKDDYCNACFKQCLRIWMDEGNQAQIGNGGKYISAIVAVITRVTFQNNGSREWLILFIISSAFATCYQLYWDIIVDWGLLQPKSVNPWLRDKLILRQKYIYFVSMVYILYVYLDIKQ